MRDNQLKHEIVTRMQHNYTMSLHPCIECGNEVRPRQQGLQCDDCGFWQHRIFMFYFRITISMTSNDSETNNLSFTSQHFTSLFLAIYLRCYFSSSLNTRQNCATRLRISGDTTMNFGKHDFGFGRDDFWAT